MVQWIHDTSPIKKETLERFKRDPAVVTNTRATATIVDRDDHQDQENYSAKENLPKRGWLQRSLSWWFPDTSNRYCVKIRYVVPPPPSFSSSGTTKEKSKEEDEAIIVVKDIQSEDLYKECEKKPTAAITVPIHLDPDYPLSGYPTIQLDRDISNCWTLLKWQIACFTTLWCYLVSACYALDAVLDPFEAGGGAEDLLVVVIIIITGPALLLPGASILRQIEHDRFIVDKLYEPTTATSSRAP